MDVLLSIKPRFAEKIFSGVKKYEYRKTVFNRPDIHKVVLYASSPVKKIIGEFEIADILFDTPESLWDRTYNYSGIDRELFFRYFVGRNKAFAICVKYPVKYRVPLNPHKIFCDFVAPQSFKYININSLT